MPHIIPYFRPNFQWKMKLFFACSIFLTAALFVALKSPFYATSLSTLFTVQAMASPRFFTWSLKRKFMRSVNEIISLAEKGPTRRKPPSKRRVAS